MLEVILGAGKELAVVDISPQMKKSTEPHYKWKLERGRGPGYIRTWRHASVMICSRDVTGRILDKVITLTAEGKTLDTFMPQIPKFSDTGPPKVSSNTHICICGQI